MYKQLSKIWFLLLALIFIPAPSFSGPESSPVVELTLWRAVFLGGGNVYNLSGLTLDGSGQLYLVDDEGPSPPGWEIDHPFLFRIPVKAVIERDGPEPVLEPVPFPRGGTRDLAGLAQKAGKMHKYDLEGIAWVGGNIFWAVDERDRLLLELNLETGSLELAAGPRDLLAGEKDLWAGRVNVAFEGVTRIGDRLFLAHEMLPTVILAYELEGKRPRLTGRITVEGCSDLTDLAHDQGYLYALGRTESNIFKIDPASGKVVARANFSRVADSRSYRYENQSDLFRNSEGLALNREYIFVVLDGNGRAILDNPAQRRPLLLVFRRPPDF